MVLILDNDDVEKLLDVNSCIEALERAYRALADGTAVDRARTQTYVKLPEPELSYCLKTMEGAIPGTGIMALRLTSDIVSDKGDDGTGRRVKLPRGPGGTYCGLIVLFSVTRLEPLAIVHDGYIQTFRVACTSALSARLLARDNAGDLGLLGSGGQAWTHLQAMANVRSLRRVRVFSPDRAHRESFAKRARDELGLNAEPVANARDAIIDADLVLAATNTNEPIVDGSWLAPGAHVISIVSGDDKLQRRELDDETLRRAAIVVANSKQVARDQNQGDLSVPVKSGILRWDQIYDLSELVAGRAPVRTQKDQITVFKNNVGLGLQFAAVAGHVYEMAQRAGIGRRVPAEWFLEKLKP